MRGFTSIIVSESLWIWILIRMPESHCPDEPRRS